MNIGNIPCKIRQVNINGLISLNQTAWCVCNDNVGNIYMIVDEAAVVVKSAVVVWETIDEVVVVAVVVGTVGSSGFATSTHFFETVSGVERLPFPEHSIK